MSYAAAAQSANLALSLYSNKKQAEMELNNLRAEAEMAHLQAAYSKKNIRDQADSLKSRQRVAVAKSGVTESGSASEVMRESAADAEFAYLSAAFEAESATRSLAQAGKDVRKGAILKQFATVINAGAKAASAGAGAGG